MPRVLRPSRLAAALVALIWATSLGAPLAGADCVDYDQYIHWVGAAVLGGSGHSFGGVAIEGDYAYVAAEQNGMHVVDIEDRTHPRRVATLPDVGYAYGIAVRGPFAYVAGNGLLVVDITRPHAPRIVGRVEAGGFPRGVAISGHYAYVTSQVTGMAVVDIADPRAPVVVGSVNIGDCYGISVSRGIAYVAGADLIAVDISDPTDPQVLATLETPKLALTIAISGSLALVFDESNNWDSGSLLAIDISDPAMPRIVGSVDFDSWARGIVVAGDIAYITSDGLDAIDISDPAHMTVLGRAFGGASVAVALNDDFAYVLDGNGAMHAIDITYPTSPSATGRVATSCFPLGVAVAGELAFVAETYIIQPYTGLLEIMDISDPARPQVVGSANMRSPAYAVAAVGNHAYVAGYDYLEVVDVTDPRNPVILGSAPVGAKALAVSGYYAFLVGQTGRTVQVVDISDPSNPLPVTAVRIAGQPYDIQIVGDLAYVAEEGMGMQIVNIADALHPWLVGTAVTPMDSSVAVYYCSVTVEGNRAYVLGDNGCLQVIDITDPRHPRACGATFVSVRSIATSYGPGMRAAAGSLYVASNGLEVLDAAGEANTRPLMTGGDWIGLASRVTVSSDYVFVTADGGDVSGSLWILPRQCDHRTGPLLQKLGNAAGQLAVSWNPTGEQVSLRLQLAHTEPVSAEIFDVTGRRVRRLLQGSLTAGVHSFLWDRRDDLGRTVPEGIYLARAATANGISTTKVVSLR